jgi:hypothetical protein
MSTEIAIIRRAREIISDPKRWTQGTYARDKDGAAIHPYDDSATCWCALGALARAAIELNAQPGDGSAATDRLINCSQRFVGSVNDHDGHAAVLSLFDKALAEVAP